MHVTGSCHCNKVNFTAVIDEDKVMVCHCTDCQILGSSAFRFGALVKKQTFNLLGDVKEYIKIGSSGARRAMVFCPNCATSIYSYAPDDKDGAYISLRLGPVHQRELFTPKFQIWCRSALPWVERLTETPSSQQQEVIATYIAKITEH
ncbi:MAG TPA: GFA family protein [Methylophilaceae bacterium]|nr:GFA family protein [Methylophilaceae bacterium]HQC29954.1 GFA family protein [Methylotenera sp.]